MPDLRDQLSDAPLGLLSRHVGQRDTVERRKTVTQRTVFVDQCSARNFSGVRGQHQIDMQLLNCILNVGIFRFGFQHPKGALKGGAGREMRLSMDRRGVLLISDVGEVQELTERPRNNQKLLLLEGCE